MSAAQGTPATGATGATADRVGPSLADERTVECRPEMPRLRPAEMTALAAEVPQWRLVERDGVVRLERVFRVPSYRAALDLANRIGLLAEEAGHHPALLIEWGRVTVRWWTLAIRGLHRNDFVMAARTDRLYDEWEWDEAGSGSPAA